MNKAVFLDKDGTLIYDLPYNVDPELITWKEDSFKALKMLADQGYLLVIVTNQAGVAKGRFTEQDLETLEKAMRLVLLQHDIDLAGFYYCPHFKGGIIPQYSYECDCRKPKPGMLIRAAKDLRIDLGASWMIGDMLKDVEAGNAAGCRTIIVEGSTDMEQVTGSNNRPLYIAPSLSAAADYIINA